MLGCSQMRFAPGPHPEGKVLLQLMLVPGTLPLSSISFTTSLDEWALEQARLARAGVVFPTEPKRAPTDEDLRLAELYDDVERAELYDELLASVPQVARLVAGGDKEREERGDEMREVAEEMQEGSGEGSEETQDGSETEEAVLEQSGEEEGQEGVEEGSQGTSEGEGEEAGENGQKRASDRRLSVRVYPKRGGGPKQQQQQQTGRRREQLRKRTLPDRMQGREVLAAEVS